MRAQGHRPTDTITDGVCEAASRALSLAYLEATGAIQHHNVDKGLLVAGQSRPDLAAASGSNRCCSSSAVVPRPCLAADIATQLPGIGDINVRLLSMIGRPVDQPQLAQVELVALQDIAPRQRRRAAEFADDWLSRVDEVVRQIIQGETAVF